MLSRLPLCGFALLLALAGCSSSRPSEQLTEAQADDIAAGEALERQLTPETYTAIVKSKTPALIDFSAAWCGPCQKMKPEVAALAKQLDGQLVVAIADMTDNEKAVAAPVAVAWEIDGYPTFVLVKDGVEIDRQVGGLPPGELTEWVRGNL